jgi:hypothetical protein
MSGAEDRTLELHFKSRDMKPRARRVTLAAAVLGAVVFVLEV